MTPRMFFRDQESGAELPFTVIGWGPEIQPKVKIDREAAKADPPKDFQEGDVYPRGHIDVQGIQIAVENPRGSTRSGVDPTGKPWSVTMANHYGFIKRTTGADGDGVDCFVGPAPESPVAFVVNQVDPRTRRFDEHKVMLGFPDEAAARAGYLANFEPDWKGLGSIRPITVEDLKCWLLEGDTTRSFAKAETGVRFITIHPNGPDEPGHAVAIREIPGQAGVYHVVGGAGGKLNGLRLHGVKSVEEYRQESKEKAEAKKKADIEKRAADRKGKSKDQLKQEAEDRQAVAQQKEADKVQAERQFIHAALESAGVDPKEVGADKGVSDFGDPDDGKAKMAWRKHHQQLLGKANEIAAEAEKKILLDADIQAQNQVDKVGGDSQFDLDDLLTEHEHQGPGYAQEMRKRAEEAGLDAAKLADHVQDIKQRSAEERVEEGRYSDEHIILGDGDPAVGIQIAAQQFGDRMRDLHKGAKALQAKDAECLKEAAKKAVLQNDQLAKVLAARKAFRTAQRQIEKNEKPESIFKEGFQIAADKGGVSSADMERIAQDTYEKMLTNHLNSFLDEVEGQFKADENLVDFTKPVSSRSLHAIRGAAAFDALHEVALASVGQGIINRDAVEALGPEGAALVMAKGLRQTFTPEEQREVLEALEAHHLHEQEHDLPLAEERARGLREDAARTQVDLVENARDLATAQAILDNKKAILEEARRTLGSTLGRIEARAALIAALRGTPREEITVPLGNRPPDSVVNLVYSLGLKDGQFQIDRDRGESTLTIKPEGMNALIQPVDEALKAEHALALAIKKGQLDQEGWIPDGFTKRQITRFDSERLEPPIFRTQLQVQGGMSPEQVHQAVEDYIGARYADGERATDILLSLNNAQTIDRVPAELQDTFRDAVTNALPLREVMKDEQGQPIMDEEDGKILPRTRAARAESIDAAAQAMTGRYFERQGITGNQAFHTQRAPENSPHLVEAMHQAMVADPRSQAAFVPQGELSPQQMGMIRDHFYEKILGQSADAKKRDEEGEKKALEQAGPEPERYGLDMFGEQSETPEWTEWHQRVQGLQGKTVEAEHLDPEEAARQKAKGWDREDSPWAKYVEAMGGTLEAQRAVQEHMKGQFLERFRKVYEQEAGQALKVGQREIPNRELYLKAAGTPEEREQARAERQAETEALRKRDTAGRFGEGSINERREEAHQRGLTAQAEQGGMFDMDEFTESPAAPDEPAADHTIKAGHRFSLGQAFEAQLANHLPQVARAFTSTRPGYLKESVSMSGNYVAQQRAVKAVQKLKRYGLFYGAGSGKTSVMLGGVTQVALDRQKEGKATKFLMAVPSIVQAQFGAEATAFIDPNSGIRVHANPGETFQERMAAYRDPGKHAVVVTHQSMRDDTLKVLAKHSGSSPEDTLKMVHEASPEELATAVRNAWKAEGVDYHGLMVDEGHDALNRKGKADSTLAKIIDALGHSSEYYIGATGSPIKNDSSEAIDWLAKIDPQRYGSPKAKAEFLRRYGVDTPVARRSLKAELTRYFFADRVKPMRKDPQTGLMVPVQAHQQDITVPITGAQAEEVKRVENAVAKIRTGAEGEDLVKWAKELSPSSFEGIEPEKAAEVAGRIKAAVGTMREAALNRAINATAEGGKIAEHVRIAQDSIAKGKPVVIFAHNLASVAAIHEGLKVAGIESVTLTGKDSSEDKATKVARFQPANWNHRDEAKRAKAEVSVIVLSDAGATGVNLQRGKTLVHHDQPMTYKTLEQRTARIHRLGQDQDVEVFNLLADHAFDRAARARVKRKEVLAEVYQSPAGYLDDSGFSEQLVKIRAHRESSREPKAA